VNLVKSKDFICPVPLVLIYLGPPSLIQTFFKNYLLDFLYFAYLFPLKRDSHIEMGAESMVGMMIFLEGNHCFQGVEDSVSYIHRINKSTVYLDQLGDSTFVCKFLYWGTLIFLNRGEVH